MRFGAWSTKRKGTNSYRSLQSPYLHHACYGRLRSRESLQVRIDRRGENNLDCPWNQPRAAGGSQEAFDDIGTLGMKFSFVSSLVQLALSLQRDERAHQYQNHDSQQT